MNLENVSPSADWHDLIAAGTDTGTALAAGLTVDADAVNRVSRRHPMRINAYWRSLIREAGDPLGRQAIPDLREITDPRGDPDPTRESAQSPVPGLVHRYPDRVLFGVSTDCAMYCRHCMRKRMVGRGQAFPRERVGDAVDYVRRHSDIAEVILSGGDPLMLEDGDLAETLTAFRRISHVERLRIHTRMPCTLPHRVTPALAELLGRLHPLYIILQFNHPREITPMAEAACGRLADAGIPLGCQSVLLAGINDSAETLAALFRRLLAIRVRPYYLHHPDPVRGTAHFHVPVQKGLAIMHRLQGRLSGIGIPQYMIDLPGGGGKIPLLPPYIEAVENGFMRIRTPEGRTFHYPIG